MYRLIAPLLVLILLATAVPSAAQESASIPSLTIANEDGAPTGAFYTEIEPGGTGQVDILLAADAEGPVEVTTALGNVTSAPNGGLALAPEGGAPTAPAAWLDLDTSPLELATGEIATRTIDIAIPPGTAPGQYVAAIILTATDPAPIPGAGGASQLARATAAIAITVPGDFDSGFTLGEPTLVPTGAGALVEVPVRNTGAVPVYPQGTLALRPAGDSDPIAIPVAMGAVFAETGTVLSVPLASIPPGDYDLTLNLTDPDTNASDRLNGLPLSVPEPPPGSTVAFERIAVDFEGTPLESVAIAVEVANTGAPIPAATLTLEVSRNGLVVDEAAIAESAALADGVTTFTTTYSPDGGYTSGLWTFRLRLESTGPGGEITLLAQSGTVAKIDVP